jgi:hypothetical protein
MSTSMRFTNLDPKLDYRRNKWWMIEKSEHREETQHLESVPLQFLTEP